MNKYTIEEKKVYYKGLREKWQAAKAIAMNGHKAEIEAIIMNNGLNISVTGFFMVSCQMKALGLDGLPYLDCKTYQGWKENGFQVKKGEKSKISGLTWIAAGGGRTDQHEASLNADDDTFLMPKEYHLFHRTQTEAIAI